MFCQAHWGKMRDAVEARGMAPLVAPDGATAVANLQRELADGAVTLDTFDPLMAVHFNVLGNVLEKVGPSAFYLLSGGPEDPVDVARVRDPALRAKYAGRTWPRCPLCYINIAHELGCAGCALSSVDGYDVAIGWAADGARATLDRLMGARP